MQTSLVALLAGGANLWMEPDRVAVALWRAGQSLGLFNTTGQEQPCAPGTMVVDAKTWAVFEEARRDRLARQ